MKCNQCSNNAMYLIGPEPGLPVCLNCYSLIQQNQQRQQDMLTDQMNYLSDSINATVWFEVSPRFPTRRPVIVSGGTVQNNHIAINNSQIGILNTGNIQNLNQTIDTLYWISRKDLAENVQKFSQTIMDESSLTSDQKNEVLESLNVLIKELLEKPENRKKSLANSLIRWITGVVWTTADSLTIWQILQPLLQVFFS